MFLFQTRTQSEIFETSNNSKDIRSPASGVQTSLDNDVTVVLPLPF